LTPVQDEDAEVSAVEEPPNKKQTTSQPDLAKFDKENLVPRTHKKAKAAQVNSTAFKSALTSSAPLPPKSAPKPSFSEPATSTPDNPRSGQTKIVESVLPSTTNASLKMSNKPVGKSSPRGKLEMKPPPLSRPAAVSKAVNLKSKTTSASSKKRAEAIQHKGLAGLEDLLDEEESDEDEEPFNSKRAKEPETQRNLSPEPDTTANIDGRDAKRGKATGTKRARDEKDER
jgi:hypothetical protein